MSYVPATFHMDPHRMVSDFVPCPTSVASSFRHMDCNHPNNRCYFNRHGFAEENRHGSQVWMGVVLDHLRHSRV